jgi:membrane dipeptidase
VVDLLVGTAIMRPEFLARRKRDHVDLPRAREGGIDVLGMSIATRLPDLRGTYSTPFFWSQGLPLRVLRSDLATAEALIARVEGWESGSGGAFKVIRSTADLDSVGAPGAPVHAFLGVQGGHVLDGDVANLERLQARGVRMLALAHVMDNDLVGSDTGIRRGGLTGLGRDVIAECQRLGLIVDLAHMSETGIHDALPLMRRPFALSHTGFTELAGGMSRWRRYSAGTRNLPSHLAHEVAAAGGLIGITLSTKLLGGETLDAFGRAVELGIEICGVEHVAIGSDLDGGLRAIVDAAGYPLLTAELLRRGTQPAVVAAVMGGNALNLLRTAAPDGSG